jgi:matrix metalloproteinase-20 (enamelysin)
MHRSTGLENSFAALLVIALTVIVNLVYTGMNQSGSTIAVAGSAAIGELTGAAANAAPAPPPSTVPHWETSSLTYRIANCPRALDCAEAQQAVREAIEAWDRASGLTLTEVTSGGDIVVSWEAGDHGDGHAFDGQGGSLGHAAYPYGSGRYATDGDVHLDDGENWAVGSQIRRYPEQIHLKTVVMHEVGHALGLDHSTRPSAMMWTTYTGIRSLTAADITAVQAIYGKPDPGEK